MPHRETIHAVPEAKTSVNEKGLERIIPLDVTAAAAHKKRVANTQSEKKIEVRIFFIAFHYFIEAPDLAFPSFEWASFVCKSTFLPLTHKCTHNTHTLSEQSPLCDEKIKLNLSEYFMRLNEIVCGGGKNSFVH